MVVELNTERTDLPLVAIPSCFPSMVDLFRSQLPRFADIARVRLHTDMISDADEIMRRLDGAEIAMTTGVHFTDDMLARLAPTVRCMTFGGTGVANFVNLAEAQRLGIRICNAVHYGDNAVAEHAIALLFEITHRAGAFNARMRDEAWPGADITEIGGLTMGLVGFGGIGRRVAELAHGLGMNLLIWARHPDERAYARLGAKAAASIDDVFANADVVSLHLALNDATQGVIGDDQLDLLRPGAAFINTARAELVRPGALERRLGRGDITAGLDVFAPEPLPADDPLRGLDNVVLTPHVAWRSDRALAGIVDQNVTAAVSYLEGESYNVVV
ncbi:hydroxyacid dehydrogenase [Bifidobacterium primatium]|uniref:Hydroxyacid dehydrogenase n=2 Tax=Bifidobacterium TaxID=1678 RepID=A0A2M9H9C4_9BIFI|nr:MULTISPECIES: NAD(P)-dependent oxidoreductase [Bifidobacterium]NEG96410.1 D-2-hydroxyacid dehydrogenase family protein [Bifidobacterium sp. SMB2]NEH10958.1 D-2-hydroxyacid dehydrogenase family protein [Bifidobacterium saimiriisciurei]PJM73406.1 hydroxyacid dehydrogenase [Bifidobacterium primatium]